ncbi:hypothetical protein KAU39_04755 [bacterium]|nr:hypothetical protein [bacterium]
MNKIRVYLLAVVLLVSFISLGIFSCSKKKKLTLSSLVISVVPNPAVVTVDSSQTFTATALRDGAPVSVDFTWSVNPSTLGTITAEGVFTAGSNSGDGTVVASAQGDSGSAEVIVSGGSFNYYGLLSDTYTTPSIKFDTNNPPDTDGGKLGLWPGAPLPVMESDATTFTEGPASTKFTISSGWAGLWLQFGYPTALGDLIPRQGKDMSAYSDAYLKFDVKTSTEVVVSVEWIDEATGNKDSAAKKINEDLLIAMDDNWHPVSIDLSLLTGSLGSINFNKICVPFAFSAEGGTVFWIDKVRWEK